MSDWVRANTCGSCANFEYEGKNSKGYCSYYKCYYWPDDSCRHYEEGNVSSGSTGCYLTSACCGHKGLADNCHELQVLRSFRDNELKLLPNGQELIDRYYRDAPAIVRAIDAHENKDAIYESMYRIIAEIVALLEQGQHMQATLRYMLLTYDLAHFVHTEELAIN